MLPRSSFVSPRAPCRRSRANRSGLHPRRVGRDGGFRTLPSLGIRVDCRARARRRSGRARAPPRPKKIDPGALIVCAVAVSVSCWSSAGLLLASFLRLHRVETGYVGRRASRDLRQLLPLSDIVESGAVRPVLERTIAVGRQCAAVTQRGAAGAARQVRRDSTSKPGGRTSRKRRPPRRPRRDDAMYFAPIGALVQRPAFHVLNLDSEPSLRSRSSQGNDLIVRRNHRSRSDCRLPPSQVSRHRAGFFTIVAL